MTLYHHVRGVLRLAARCGFNLNGLGAVWRHLHTTNPLTRDLLAKYRPTPPSTALPSVSARLGSIPRNQQESAFETHATVPTASSFQEVPPPQTGQASHVETPIPAMTSPAGSSTASVSGATVPAGARRSLETSQTRKEVIVQGVPLPPKPVAPGEEDCCMSGCVHCVYTIYADDLEAYTSAIDSARTALTTANVPAAQWPDEVRTSRGKEVQRREEKRMEEGMDPAMAAFLALENKLKKKQAPESSAAT